MGESFVYQMAYMLGQVVGVFVIVFVFVIFPILGIIYLVKRKRLERKLGLKSKKHDPKSYKM